MVTATRRNVALCVQYIACRVKVGQSGRHLYFFSAYLLTLQLLSDSLALPVMLFRLNFHLLRGPLGYLLPVKSGLTALHPSTSTPTIPLALSTCLHLR